jgi:sortase A
MTAYCRHLGLERSRNQIYLTPNTRHRCYLGEQSQRIALTHQSMVCLSSGYRRCPRLIAAAASKRHSAEPATKRASRVPHGREHGRTVDSNRRREQLTELQAVKGTAAKRRSLTPTEMLVAGLVASIAVALLFVGYAIFYRLQITSGVPAPGTVLSQAVEAQVEPSPSPTPLPTVVAAQPTTATPQPATASVVAPATAPTPTASPPLATPPRIPATSPPTRLVIDAIDLDIPVQAVGLKTVRQGGRERVLWGDVANAGAFHATSAYPGNPGNTVINGHRDIKGSVFRYLDQLEVGDSILLYVGEEPYPYEVAEILTVPETFASAAQRAENARLIGYQPEERLTLITCTPIGLATHRLLVIARPPGPEMPAAGDGGS